MNGSRVYLLLLFCLVLLSCSKSNNSAPTPVSVTSTLTVVDVIQARETKIVSSFRFFINVSPVNPQDIKVNYTTKDGTAVGGKDYVPTSGTLTIAANKSFAYVDVNVVADSLRQAVQTFTLELSAPVNATLVGTGKATATIQNDGTYLPTDNTGYSTPSSYPGYTLAWSDEFSARSLDLTAWNQEIGNGANGWGNHELEYYTNSTKNSFLSNGNLIIEARKEAISGFNYSSARLTTQNKKSFKYGRIDIRAKLPVAKGMWPALWMLGSNITSVPWPGCGEIDIMELVGSAPSNVKATLHWKDGAGNHASKGADYTLSGGNFSQQFHVFSLIWVKDMVKCYVDDHLTATVTSTDLGAVTNPFNADQFFIFNVATGGDWPGPPDLSTSFPQQMFVDYVRVFQ